MKSWTFRCLLFTHRYLGIGLGWLLLVWCLSGFVMMYVPYPELREEARMSTLDDLELSSCCALANAALEPDERVARFEVEMLNGRAVLRLRPDFGPAQLLDLRTGAPVEVNEAEATSFVHRFAAARQLELGSLRIDQIDRDQWTVYGFDDDRPLYRIALGDRQGTATYVSGASGKLVQLTTRSQRFWNWLGAVPHWLYPMILRENVALWTRLVVWSSLSGAVLALLGVVLGVWQLRRSHTGKISSPYRGWKWWHHVPGLLFGVLVLSWVTSGFVSMNPWGLFESESGGEAVRLQGELPTWRGVRELLEALPQAALPSGIVHIESAVLNGQLYAVTTTRRGERRRFDQQWRPYDLNAEEISAAVTTLDTTASWQRLDHEDEFYYSHGADKLSLPVIRVLANGAQSVRYYLDPVSGALVKRVDEAARGYRWWHYGLHRWDFVSALRARPLWDVLVCFLLGGATLVTATGVWLGVRHLRGR